MKLEGSRERSHERRGKQEGQGWPPDPYSPFGGKPKMWTRNLKAGAPDTSEIETDSIGAYDIVPGKPEIETDSIRAYDTVPGNQEIETESSEIASRKVIRPTTRIELTTSIEYSKPEPAGLVQVIFEGIEVTGKLWLRMHGIPLDGLSGLETLGADPTSIAAEGLRVDPVELLKSRSALDLVAGPGGTDMSMTTDITTSLGRLKGLSFNPSSASIDAGVSGDLPSPVHSLALHLSPEGVQIALGGKVEAPFVDLTKITLDISPAGPDVSVDGQAPMAITDVEGLSLHFDRTGVTATVRGEDQTAIGKITSVSLHVGRSGIETGVEGEGELAVSDSVRIPIKVKAEAGIERGAHSKSRVQARMRRSEA